VLPRRSGLAAGGGNPRAKLVDGFAEVERAAGDLEPLIHHPGDEPVVLAPVNFPSVVRQLGHDGAAQVYRQRPAGVVQRLDPHTELMLPLTVALHGVPRPKPDQRVESTSVGDPCIVFGHGIIMTKAATQA
jgi:hypothetical protein